MKPEIKAMLPELPRTVCLDGRTEVYYAEHIEAWLDKLTEGAEIRYGSELGHVITTDCERGDTHRYLVIPLGEIKKQTPLEIAVEALKNIRDSEAYESDQNIAVQALAQIEVLK